MVHLKSAACDRACETRRKLAAVLAVTVLVLCVAPAAAGQPPARQEPGPVERETGVPPANQAATEEHAVEEHAEEEHGGGWLDMVARLFNFAILAGTLVYLLKSPLRTYLADRSAQIRSDLVNAAEMKAAAAAQIEQIDRKMQALPGELEALRVQGAQDVAAEEARIRAAAAAERDRLLEQARRDIDLQVKVAERELVSHAAELAVGVASERIRKNITDADQQRLVDRYVQQLKG